ncbi:MAG: LuxR C-terminal-related transcriptional regulator [Chloroflexota bacterium]|nr:LuxR C-terminal-related transcriptional regulator [Chloroflexota bacterium]
MSGQTTAYRNSSLPTLLTPLIGRQGDVSELVALVERGERRLITLTGPGGVGKSRLAIEVARELLPRYGENLAFVSLSHVSAPENVVPTIAQAIDVRESGVDTLLEDVQEALRGGPFLLVLDNMEQVVDAASVIAQVLHHCPALTIIATSQVRLRISGEHEFAVRTLAVEAAQDPDRVSLEGQPDAVRLFVDRAKAVNDEFELTAANIETVGRICRALDGLPLAIELAAARIKILSPEALLERLDRRLSILTGGGRDLPHRQQTMRNAIAWSYDLLTPEEQRAMRRLAVFSGGFSLEAALATEYEGDDSLELVASLVDKNLVRRLDGVSPDPRYFMFETIREFGREQLEAHGESAEAFRRHAHYYLELARRGRSEWVTEKAHRWVLTMDAELANMRVAFTWFAEHDRLSGLHMASSLDWYWDASLLYREGRSWLETFLPEMESLPPEQRTLALRSAAFLNMRLQDLPAAIGFADIALDFARENGDRRTLIDALSGAGAVNAESGQYEAASQIYSEMLELSRQEGYARGIAVATHNLGLVSFASGDIERALALNEEALELDRSAGNRYSLLNSLNSLAMVLIQAGEIERAAGYMKEQLEIASSENLDIGVALFALVATYNGQYATATQMMGANAAVAEQAGSRLYGSSLADRVFDPVMDTLQEALGEAEFARNLAIGRTLEYEKLVESARDVLSVILEGEPASGPAPVQPVSTPQHDLSPRELEVLRELAKGGSNSDIADTLFISVPTVKVHVRSILTKLNLSSRTAAAAWAIQNGLN